uniref:Myeloid leukemia factor n=1 Tax=Kalanchoe fedtschenkoi TaxID=63787 RepID=A0A7N0TIM2_KALFE
MQREGETGDSFTGMGFWRSRIFGGRNPFDHPFFTRPSAAISTSPPAPTTAIATANKGPIIKQLNSDGEEEDEEEEEDVKEEAEKKNNGVTNRNHRQKMDDPQVAASKIHSFSYRKVTYGGVDGAYRTSTVSRRTASDGVVLEESKAADKTTGQAEHRISRVIENKGHSVTRMLKPDGKVETMRTLHNLNEDELAGFEKTWEGNAGIHLGRQNDKEELKKDYFPGAGIRAWNSSSPNWDNKAHSMVAASRADERVRTSPSSSVSTVKRIVRIPIE